MCNRIVQNRRVVKPGERIMVLLKGPGAVFQTPFDGAVFGGPARQESRSYWTRREKAEDVIVPYVNAFGEKHEQTGRQGWEAVPSGSALAGFLLPQPSGKDYRLLKVVTQPATADQLQRLGNDRAPIVLSRVLEPLAWREAVEADRPAPGEVVWTTDLTSVRRGIYESNPPDASQGRIWKDMEGREIVVKYWMSRAEDQIAAPDPPRLLYEDFEMPEVEASEAELLPEEWTG